MIELIALFSSVSFIAFVIFIVIVLVMIVRRTGRRPQARGLFTRRCPNCRDIISDRATICPNCHGETGFGRRSQIKTLKPPLPKKDFGLRGPEEEARHKARVVNNAQQMEKQQRKRLERARFLWFVIVAFLMLIVAVVVMLELSTKGRADPLPYKKVGQCVSGY
jgi:hypothetical protein